MFSLTLDKVKRYILTQPTGALCPTSVRGLINYPCL